SRDLFFRKRDIACLAGYLRKLLCFPSLFCFLQFFFVGGYKIPVDKALFIKWFSTKNINNRLRTDIEMAKRAVLCYQDLPGFKYIAFAFNMSVKNIQS